jgi:predicted DNA-binding transcriptional regulator AlpA
MKLISKPVVCDKLGGISRATLDRKRTQPDFPKPTKPKENRSARCYWFEHEVDAYLLKQAAARDRPHDTSR